MRKKKKKKRKEKKVVKIFTKFLKGQSLLETLLALGGWG